MESHDICVNTCHSVGMTQSIPLSEREVSILNAAFEAFATYGYRRTAMDDIARGAGMSRTALYQYYRNKEEIFRSLSHAYFDQAVADMHAALRRPGLTVDQALLACFVAKDGKFMEVVLTTPHGAEMLDAGFAISGDLAAEGEVRMVAVLAEWLKAMPLPAGVGPAKALADVIMASLYGLRHSVTTMAELRAGEARLALMIARAIR